MDERITRAQMARIWASAHELGLDRETLYLIVPGGSISGLTRREASGLIRRLAGAEQGSSGAGGGSGGSPATERQLRLIHLLLTRLGWQAQPGRVHGFLRKYAHVGSVSEIPDRKRASAVIEALKAMVKRRFRGKVPSAAAPRGDSRGVREAGREVV